MGCNCGKPSAPKEFRYVSPTGEVKVYRTEVEAQAAKIRNGGGKYDAVAK